MFTLSDISTAHAKVKSGSDFPAYVKEIRTMGITGYNISVTDGHAEYFGGDSPLLSDATYEKLDVNPTLDRELFISRLKLHQSGGTDYMTFCRDCADSGIGKWTLDLEANTCTYYDTMGETVLVEKFS